MIRDPTKIARNSQHRSDGQLRIDGKLNCFRLHLCNAFSTPEQDIWKERVIK